MKFSVFYKKINQAIMIIAAFWTMLLAVDIAIDVFSRTVFNKPVIGTVEIIRNSVVMIAFLQLPYAVYSESMLRADFLIKIISKRISKIFEFIGLCLGACLFGILVYGAIDLMVRAYVSGEFEGEGAFQIPVWPIYCVIIFGAAMAALNYVVAAVGLISREGADHGV